MAEAANPFDGIYWTNLAALDFHQKSIEAQDKRGREGANASSRYAKSELTRQAPLRYAANRNTANSQGLLESGQLAQRQAQTQADLASKQARIAEQRKAAIERYNEADTNAGKEYQLGVAKEQVASGQRATERLERNPPPPEVSPAAQPPQIVSSSPQPRTRAARSAAGSKAAGTPRSRARG